MAIRKRNGLIKQLKGMTHDVSSGMGDASMLLAKAEERLDAVTVENVEDIVRDLKVMMSDGRAIVGVVAARVTYFDDHLDSFLEGIDGDGYKDYAVITWTKRILGSVTMIWPLIRKFISRR